ncbi:MAG: hypothetical protein IPJ82_22270 [Lewinellaceae bacterium]|nr:hypothetical protein [Lewinellaceae bacterium]
MRITLEVNNSKAAFFLELLQSLSDFVTVKEAIEYEAAELSGEHIAILEERLMACEKSPESLVDWEAFQRIVKS